MEEPSGRIGQRIVTPFFGDLAVEPRRDAGFEEGLLDEKHVVAAHRAGQEMLRALIHEIPAQMRKAIKGVLAPDPIERWGEAEDAEEAGGGLIVTGGNGAPFLQPGPQASDPIAVVVDLVRAGDGRFVAKRQDGGTKAHVPDILAEGMAGVAAVGRDPLRHARQIGFPRRLGQDGVRSGNPAFANNGCEAHLSRKTSNCPFEIFDVSGCLRLRP